MSRVHCRGRRSAAINLMHVIGTLLCKSAKFVINYYFLPSFFFMVENHTLGNMNTINLFQTNSLCGDLHFIASVGLAFSSLVFDGDWLPIARIGRVQNGIFAGFNWL